LNARQHLAHFLRYDRYFSLGQRDDLAVIIHLLPHRFARHWFTHEATGHWHQVLIKSGYRE
jgi:hypothetical protein